MVAAVRSEDRANSIFGPLHIQPGIQPDGRGILFVHPHIDITCPDTITDALYAGVTQVVSVVGSVRRVKQDEVV